MKPFQSILVKKPKLNKFDLSFEKKMTCSMGFLYPILLQEILPSDKFKVNSEILIRFAPMLAPVMHRINVYTHYFFVPNRILWDEWEDFITGGEDGLQAPVFPTIAGKEVNRDNMGIGSLSDYFGLPIAPADMGAAVTQISALPFRGYSLIWNEYYRDQNLIDKLPVPKTSGPELTQATTDSLMALRERAWEKDYLTSSLPFAQRGNPASAPMSVNYSTTSTVAGDEGLFGNVEYTIGEQNNMVNATGDPLRVENIESATMLINDLRKASALQRWLEKSARGGSRYREQLLSFFGVVSDDARMQIPEFLGGGKQPVTISENLTTYSNLDATGNLTGDPAATMSGHGISVGKTNGFSKTFKEHGYVHCIMSVIPRTNYQQSLHRHWRKFDKFDYYFKEFANLGEQAVTESEAFYDWKEDNTLALTNTWGYQERYAEYKYNEGQISGDFRGPDNLSFWHLGRYFTTKPFLNQTFITCRPSKRIFAVIDPDVDELWVQIYHKISALRPMPSNAIPSLM